MRKTEANIVHETNSIYTKLVSNSSHNFARKDM